MMLYCNANSPCCRFLGKYFKFVPKLGSLAGSKYCMRVWTYGSKTFGSGGPCQVCPNFHDNHASKVSYVIWQLMLYQIQSMNLNSYLCVEHLCSYMNKHLQWSDLHECWLMFQLHSHDNKQVMVLYSILMKLPDLVHYLSLDSHYNNII